MADIGTAYFRVAPNMTGVQGKIASGLKGSGSAFGEQFGKELGTKSSVIFGAIAGITMAATQKAVDLISSSVSDAVRRVDILNNFPKVMSNMGISFEDAAKASEKLDKGLRGLPTTLDTGTLAVQRLTTKTQDVDKATKIFLALNNAVLAGGAPMELQRNATEQFAQAFAKGKPDMMEWRSILSTMPAQLSQVAKQLGMASVDEFGASLRSGAVSMDDFANALIALNTQGVAGLPNLQQQAKNATAGIGTSIEVMKTAITRGLAAIMTAFGTTNISEAITKIGAAFEGVLKSLAGGLKFIVDNKDIFLPIAAGITGALVALKAWTTYLAVSKTVMAVYTATTQYFTLVNSLMAQGLTLSKAAMLGLNIAMSANPIGIIIALVAGLVAGLTYFFTQTETGRRIFTAAWSAISSAVQGVFNWIKQNWPLLLSILTGPIGMAVSLIIRNWDAIKNGASNMLNAVVSFFRGLPGRVLGAIGNFGSLLYNSGRDLVQGLLNGAGSLLSSVGKFFLDKLPGWIQGPFKSALGISSPSKVFAGYGENIGEGLVGGLNDSKSMIKGAVNDMTNSALAGVTNPLFSSAVAFSSQGGVGQGPTTGGTSQSVTIGTVVLNDQSAVKEFFKQLNQDTIKLGMGLTPNQGAV